jgi:hypothetical protein
VRLALGRPLDYTATALGPDTPLLTPAGLRARLSAVLAALDLEACDVLTVCVPKARSRFNPQTDFGALVAACEDLCTAAAPSAAISSETASAAPPPSPPLSLAQCYVVDCDGWTILPDAAGEVALAQGQPLKELLRAADALPTAAGAGAGAAATGRGKLAGISYPASLTAASALMPVARDATTGKEWSVAQVAREFDLAQFVRAPLDCDMSYSIRSGSSSPGGVLDPSAQSPAPFRCVDSPLHVAYHPRKYASVLGDTLNELIHLEFLWDNEVGPAATAHLEQDRAARITRAAQEAARVQAEQKQHAAQRETAQTTTARDAAGNELSVEVESSAPSRFAPASQMTNSNMQFSADPEAPEPKDRAALAMDPLPALPQPDDAKWARIIASNLPRFTASLHEWRQVRAYGVDPAVDRLVAYARQAPAARDWALAYKSLMVDLVSKLDIHTEQMHSPKAADLARRIDAILPFLREQRTVTLDEGRSTVKYGLASRVLRLFTGAADSPISAVLTEAPEAFRAMIIKNEIPDDYQPGLDSKNPNAVPKRSSMASAWAEEAREHAKQIKRDRERKQEETGTSSSASSAASSRSRYAYSAPVLPHAADGMPPFQFHTIQAALPALGEAVMAAARTPLPDWDSDMNLFPEAGKRALLSDGSIGQEDAVPSMTEADAMGSAVLESVPEDAAYGSENEDQ